MRSGRYLSRCCHVRKVSRAGPFAARQASLPCRRAGGPPALPQAPAQPSLSSTTARRSRPAGRTAHTQPVRPWLPHSSTHHADFDNHDDARASPQRQRPGSRTRTRKPSSAAARSYQLRVAVRANVRFVWRRAGQQNKVAESRFTTIPDSWRNPSRSSPACPPGRWPSPAWLRCRTTWVA